MILEQLKKGTASLHQEVEQDNLATLIMDASINQKQYEVFLRQNFVVYKAVEDFINARYDNLPESLNSFAGYKKTNALAKDITGFSNLPLPQPLRIPGTRDVATLVGKLYVIEGSMVGGMMMSKRLQSCEHLSHIKEHHFFNGDVQTSLARWKNFKEVITLMDFKLEEIDIAVKSARDTFYLFKEAYKKEIV